MRTGGRLALGLMVVVLASAGQARGAGGGAVDAQAPLRALDVADVMNLRTLHGEPAFHPIEDIVAMPLSRRRDAPAPEPGWEPHFLFSVDRRGVPTSENASRVVLVDLRDGMEREILPGASRSWAPTWSPDGRLLAFLSDEGGQIGLWVWDRSGATARRIDLPAAPMISILSPLPVWLPDSRRILISTRNDRSPDYERRVTSQAPRHDGIDIFASPDESHFSGNTGNGFPTRLLADITSVDVYAREATVILPDVAAIGLWASPDGRWLAIENTLGSGMATQRLRSRLSFLDLNSGATVADERDIVGGYASLTALWSPDGAAFVYLNEGSISFVRPSSGPAPTILAAPPEIGTIMSGSLALSRAGLSALVNMDVAGRRTSRLLEVDLHRAALRSLAFSDQFDFLALVSDARGQADRDRTILGRDVRSQEAVVLRANEQGDLRVVQRGGFAFSSPAARYSSHDDSAFFTFLEQPDHPMEIWRVDASRDMRVHRSRLNEPLSRVAFATPRLLQAQAESGVSLTGVLLVPPQWREGRRCPLIVRPYGDQRPARLLYRFGVNGSGTENLQLLASRGYAVLVPELPIASGEPLHSVRARVGTMVRQARALGIADSNRLGVFGHSFGGYAATSLITDEQGGFRSAVVTAPVGLDLFSYYGFMDRNGASAFIGWTEDGQARVNANPWSDPARLAANSPLLQIDRAQGPVLIVQGSADQPRVPQSNELFVGLRRLGKRAEYRLYSGEPHWPDEWGASNTVDYLDRMLGWFDITLARAADEAGRERLSDAVCS